LLPLPRKTAAAAPANVKKCANNTKPALNISRNLYLSESISSAAAAAASCACISLFWLLFLHLSLALKVNSGGSVWCKNKSALILQKNIGA